MFSILLATVLTFGSTANAQDGVGTELERSSASTPDEMKAFSVNATASIKELAANVDKMTEQARKEGDASVLECLTPRNVSMQALVQVSESAAANMITALNKGDQERADHEMRKLSVSQKKAEAIHAEAQNCLGGTYNKGTENVVVVPGAGDDSDSDDRDDISELDVGFDPPAVSPFEG